VLECTDERPVISTIPFFFLSDFLLLHWWQDHHLIYCRCNDIDSYRTRLEADS
jgi:hypothetical protein